MHAAARSVACGGRPDRAGAASALLGCGAGSGSLAPGERPSLERARALLDPRKDETLASIEYGTCFAWRGPALEQDETALRDGIVKERQAAAPTPVVFDLAPDREHRADAKDAAKSVEPWRDDFERRRAVLLLRAWAGDAGLAASMTALAEREAAMNVRHIGGL